MLRLESHSLKSLTTGVGRDFGTFQDDDGPSPLFCSNDAKASLKPQPSCPFHAAAQSMSLAKQMMSNANAAAREKKAEDSKQQ
jgi:hypothetical protein